MIDLVEDDNNVATIFCMSEYTWSPGDSALTFRIAIREYKLDLAGQQAVLGDVIDVLTGVVVPDNPHG
ncbi:MAG: hypothetical protein MI757_06860 [Pirellulales bacterium]|nr:hypothetical protein [Pirellulales bacterium]